MCDFTIVNGYPRLELPPSESKILVHKPVGPTKLYSYVKKVLDKYKFI